ncbi:MAG: hypothetical protein ACRYGA_07065 [Janthinobacterium lividum]
MSSTPPLSEKHTESVTGEEDPGAAIDTSPVSPTDTRLPEGHPEGEKVPCPACDGIGHDEIGKSCAVCQGKGTITVISADRK